MRYLWRAVDHEGEILESFVTKKRDKAAALRFMKKALKRHGSPEGITTDGTVRANAPLISYLVKHLRRAFKGLFRSSLDLILFVTDTP